MSSRDCYITRVTPKQSEQLRVFLEGSDINNSFHPPLSQRTTTIGERVAGKFADGFWLGAFLGDQIIGCRGCNGVKDGVVEFSTTAVSMQHRQLGLGRALLSLGVLHAFSFYGRFDMTLDTTPDNTAFTALVQNLGFRGTDPYLDEQKRGPGGHSVQYTLQADTLLGPNYDPSGVSSAVLGRQIAEVNKHYASGLAFLRSDRVRVG